MTDVKLNLFTDIDQYLFIEEVTRGGVAMISYQYTRASHPFMENCGVSKRNRYIMNLDANDLYGQAMSQPLLTSIFKWLAEKKTGELDVVMVQGDIF